MDTVIFDMDGTIIDSSEGITKCVQYALHEFGIDEPDRTRLQCFVGPPLYQSFMKFYGFSKEKAWDGVHVYRSRYNTQGIYECHLYPGVREALERLHAAGCRLGMASSKPEVSCRQILERFGILDLFDEVVGSTMDGRIETKADVLGELFRRWGVTDTSDMVLVGDTLYDIEGANEAGIASIAVSYGFGDVEEMRAAGAMCVCDTMAEVAEVVLHD